MADRAYSVGFEDLQRLVRDAGAQGLYIGPDQVVAASKVIVAFEGVDDERIDGAALKTALGAIFCKTPAEQRSFHDLFDEWFPSVAVADDEAVLDEGLAATNKAVVRAANPWPYAIFAMVCVAIIFTGSYLYYRDTVPGGTQVATIPDPDRKTEPAATADGDAAPVDGQATAPELDTEQTSGTETGVSDDATGEIVGESEDKPDGGPVADPDDPGKSVSAEIAEDINIFDLPDPEPEPQRDIIDLDAPDVVEIEQPAAMGWWDTYSIYFLAFRNAAAATPFILFFAWLLWRWSSKQAWMERRAEREPPDLSTLRIARSGEKLFGNRDYTSAIQQLRRHHRRPTRNLDVERTMLATVRRVGLFSPVFEHRQSSPEYLVLADRSTLSDHQAHLVSELVEQSKAEQLFVDLYYFDGDPRVCYSEKGRLDTVTLGELAARHGGQRLLIAADGAALIDPLRGTLRSWADIFNVWPERAVIVTQTGDRWGAEQVVLHRAGFGVIPLDEEGLRDLAEAFEEAGVASGEFIPPYVAPRSPQGVGYPPSLIDEDDLWLDPTPVSDDELDALVDELRDYLGADGYELLGACASFPQPHWDVTVYLDGELHEDADATGREQRLLRLAQLPWFRRGQMPDYLRLRFIDDLAPDREALVKRALQDLLRSAIDAPPGAAEIEVAQRHEPGAKRLLTDFLQFGARQDGDGLHDHIFIRSVLGAGPSRLDVQLPQVLHKILPWKGWDAFTAGAAARGVAGVIAAAVLWAGFTLFEGPMRGVTVLSPELRATLPLADTDLVASRVITSLDFSPVENRFVAVAADRTVYLGHITDGGLDVDAIDGIRADWARFVESGREIAVRRSDNTLELHALAHLENRTTNLGRAIGKRATFAISPARSHLVTADGADVSYIRLGHRLAEQPAFTHPDPVDAVAMDETGTTLSAASRSHLTLFDLTSRSHTTYRLGEDHLTQIGETTIARLWHFAPNRLMLHYENGKVLAFEDGRIAIVSQGPEGTVVSAMSEEMWRDGDARFPIQHGHGSHDLIAWGPGASETSMMHDRPVSLHALRGHGGLILSNTTDRHGGHVVTSSADATVRIWNMKARDEVAVLRGHDDAVLAAALAPDNGSLVSVAQDGTIGLWDVSAVLPPHEIPPISTFDQDPIVIGVAAPPGLLGREMVAGVRAAAERLNALDGLLGRRIDVIVADETCGDASAAGALSSKGVQMVIGGACAEHNVAAAQHYAATGVTQISMAPLADRSADAPDDTTVFIGEGFGDVEGEIAGTVLADRFGAFPIAILHDRSAAALGRVEQARAAMALHGIEPAIIERVDASDGDVAGVVSRLRETRAETVYMALSPTSAGLVLRIAQSQGFAPQFVGGHELADATFASIAGDAADGMMVSVPPATPDALDWRADAYVLHVALTAWAEAVRETNTLAANAVAQALSARLSSNYQISENFPEFPRAEDSDPPYSWLVWQGGELMPQRSGSQALIVGVGEYLHNNPMATAAGDIALMTGLLRRHLGFRAEQITTLADAAATYDNVIAEIERLIASTGQGDRVFLYLSANGGQIADINGDEPDKVEETIVVHDSALDQAGTDNLTDDTLEALLDRLAGRDVTVVLDTHHAVMVGEAGYDLAARRTEPTFVPAAPGRRVWSATAPLQSAWAGQEASIFTRFFVEGVGDRRADRNRDDVVTNAELFTYLRTASAGWCTKERECREGALSPMLEIDPAELGQAVAPADARVPPHMSRSPRAASTHALIIGVSAYDRIAPNAHASGDARRVRDALRESGVPAENVALLTDAVASRDAIVAAWQTILRAAEPGDVVIVYLSGETRRFPERIAGSESDARDEAFLLAGYDAQSPEPEQIILDDQLHQLLESAPHLRTIMIADTSHAGTLGDDEGDDELGHVFYFGAVGDTQTMTPINVDDAPRGALSNALADALSGAADRNGDGFIDTRELQQAVRNGVLQSTRGRQNPVVRPNGRDQDHILSIENALDVIDIETPLRLHVIPAAPEPDLTAELANVVASGIEDADLVWDAKSGEMIGDGTVIAALGGTATASAVQGFINMWQVRRKIDTLPESDALRLRIEPESAAIDQGGGVRIVIDGNDNRDLVLFHIGGNGRIDVLVPGTQAPGVSLNGTVTPGETVTVPVTWPAAPGEGRLIAVTHDIHQTPLIRALRGSNRQGDLVRMFNALYPALELDDVQAATIEVATAAVASGQKTSSIQTVDEDLVFQFGHTRQVNAVAFTPDRRYAASGANDGTIKVWDVSSGAIVANWRADINAVNTLAFTGDGRLLVSGGNEGVVKLWNPWRQNELRRFAGAGAAIQAIAVSSDGGRLIAGSSDNLVYVWDFATAALQRTLKGHRDWVRDVAFGPDGSTAASAGDDNVVRLWDIESGTETATLEGHSHWVMALDYSPDGSQIVTGSGDGTARLWQSADGTAAGVIDRQDAWVRDVAFTPDGTSVLIAGDSGVLRRIALADNTSTDFATTGARAAIVGIAVSADGTVAATGGADLAIRIMDLASGGERQRFAGYAGSVSALTFDERDRQIVTAATDGALVRWDAATGQRLETLFAGNGAAVNDLQTVPGSRRLLVAGEARIDVWNLDRRAVAESFEGHEGAVLSVATLPDGSGFASSGSDGTVLIWDFGTPQPVHRLEGHTDWVRDIAIAPDGSALISASDDSRLVVWDVASGTRRGDFMAHGNWVRAVAISPDGRLAASADDDLKIIVWEIATSTIVHQIEQVGGLVHALAFDADGAAVIAANGTTIERWELASGERTMVYASSQASVTSLDVSADGLMIASGDAEGMTLWRADRPAPLAHVSAGPAGGYMLRFSDGTWTGSEDAIDDAVLWFEGREIVATPVRRHPAFAGPAGDIVLFVRESQ